MNRVLLAILACCAVLAPSQARAAEAPTATVSHVEAHDGTVNLLVSVPAGARVDLAGVSVTVDDEAADTDASLASSTSAAPIRRTAVLAMDTSESMKGARFAAARAAAKSYLASVPADVAVGIVSFDGSVHSLLSPTTDRAAAGRVVDGLRLAHGTVLYDGIKAAVKELGTQGQRTILLLSDGKNTNSTPLSSVTSAISAAKVSLDAVALDQSAGDLGALRGLTEAGNGQLVPAGTDALGTAFAAEAAALARQVLVTVKVPSSVTKTEADISVALPLTGGTTLHAATYAVVRDGGTTPTKAAYQLKEATHALQLPPSVLYGGLAALGLGLAVLLSGVLSMAGGNGGMRGIEQRIAAYGPGAVLHKAQAKGESAFNLEQAKEAAASMLHRNKGLEARIEQRLDAGGSALKPAEWLLLHGVIAILAGLVGLMLGGGNILLLLVGLALGVALPWWWLGRKQKKRVHAFNSGLADTLQLIAGSLSAGMSLAQAIDAVVNEGNEPIAGEFKRVLIESRLGVPLEIALEGIAQRIESVDFAWVVMAIRIQREVGGNLAELLTTVAGTLRERDYLRRQVQTLSAEGRLSAYILIALPIAMAGYLFLTRRSFLEPLYTTGLGYLMIAGCVVLLSLGWVTMSKIVKVEV